LTLRSSKYVNAIVTLLETPPERERGSTWSLCVSQRDRIEHWLRNDLRLTKVWRLLGRDGIEIPYPTLHRFAVAELAFGQKAATIAVLDGEPGDEMQLDVGWVGWLRPDLAGRRRRFRGGWATGRLAANKACSTAGSGNGARNTACSDAHSRYFVTVLRLKPRSRAIRRSPSPSCMPSHDLSHVQHVRSPSCHGSLRHIHVVERNTQVMEGRQRAARWSPIGRKPLAPYRAKTPGPASPENTWPPIPITRGLLSGEN
jgi:hypothetical protein